MKSYRLALAALFLPLVDACSGGGAGSSGSLPQTAAQLITPATRHGQGILPTPPPLPRYNLIYSFQAGADGSYPGGGSALVNVNGGLYGITGSGGTYGDGTFFTVNNSGLETVLYSFKGGTDGNIPVALTAVNGLLYGTTMGGGISDEGTVFTTSTSGTERVLYSFKGGTDGAEPYAGSLVDVNGLLYGTTYYGGLYSGTVFEVSTSGAERVLHSFKGGKDGVSPLQGLTAVNGVLYGTTQAGGANNDGTVYALSTSGAENVLYSFNYGFNTSFSPQSSLIDVNGELYGTTSDGGKHGVGEVFKISTSGAESDVYDFTGYNGDGAWAGTGGLVDVNGELYGTTYGGGDGFGTIYEISPSGAETVLYRFKGQPDGAFPDQALLYVDLSAGQELLYGTTFEGGANGRGTVFSYCISKSCHGVIENTARSR